tara:strand:- start:755 stop:1384 length:630 start_codon:yes stop_codon:yes gene_type:complete
MNTKVVTDFFGITSPNDENKADTVVAESENDVFDDGEQKVGDKENDGSVDDSVVNVEDEEDESVDEESDDDEITDDESEEEDDNDLQKLEGYAEKNVLINYHPEVVQISEKELYTLSNVVKDKNGVIIDPLHKTIPIMTKYEKAKIIGIRAQQINSGSEPFIPVDPNVIDGLTIANEELKKRKIPFIIRRPMPNGASEYWNINDLELLE